MNGDDAALSEAAQADLALFLEKGCSACHSGVNVDGHGYYPFGLNGKPGAEVLPEDDKGRTSGRPKGRNVSHLMDERSVAKHTANGRFRPLAAIWLAREPVPGLDSNRTLVQASADVGFRIRKTVTTGRHLGWIVRYPMC